MPREYIMSTIMHTHVLVVGAGPAGIAAAITLQKLGIDHLLVDKATFPREKLCAGLFTAKGQEVLCQLVGTESAEGCMSASLAARQSNLVFWNGQQHITSVPLVEDILLVHRPQMDAWLVTHYQGLGGAPRLGDALVGLDVAAHIATLASGAQIRYDYLVGADGANSRVRHLVRPDEKRPKILACEVNLPRQACPMLHANIHFDIVPRTYAWVFDKGDSVCIGMSQMPGVDIDLKMVFRHFLADVGVDFPSQVTIHGAIIPYDVRPTYSLGDGILLAGDAAGTVEPMTLEGISYALESGQRVAQAIASGTVADLKPRPLGNGHFVQDHLLEKRWFLDLFYRHAPRHTRFMARFYDEYINHHPHTSVPRMALMLLGKAVKNMI